MESDALFSIEEAADKSGVSRRTVRYYVQRGLIDPPIGRGRASGYSAEHIAQIQRVLRLQREGMDLESISRSGESDDPPAPVAQLVLKVPLTELVALEIHTPEPLPSQEQLTELRAACRRILGQAN